MNMKIDTMKSPNEIPEESRKRRLEDLDAGSLRLSTPSCYTNCDAAVFEKPENSTFDSALNIRIAKNISGFRSYTHEEEARERFLGVSTKLKLWIDGSEGNDPWKIKKTLKHSDCDRLYRLTLCKDMVQNHIIKVWEEAGKVDEIEKVVSDEGVAVKVWDYEREREYELKLKKQSSSKSYVVSGAWRKEFVKERRLKKGDIIGLYWCTSKSRFVFSVLARAPPVAVSERGGE
ncbi:B3 domain-containing protein At2g33720 [Daucus carota subsp. sativus]|nr:PREDICTED: B3 domain-containing protein At2g33720-like [Daucus carota subsp. sativus]